MKVVEGWSINGGGGAAGLKGRRDSSRRRRRLSGGVSVRRRVQVMDAAATAVLKKGRRDDARMRRRLMTDGVSLRRRVQVVEAAAVAPPPTPLQRLLAACRRAFGGPGTVPAPDDVAVIRGILVKIESAFTTSPIVSFADKIGPEDVHLSAVTKAAAASGVQRRRRPIITRTTIYECADFSIVIFLLPPGAVIPLHDHPGMTVFSKLLLGSLHVKSYDWATAGGSTTTTPASSSVPAASTRRLAKLVLDADLRAPCGAVALFPESGGNIHRFAAATSCAVLDVLGPPYSAGERDCTYYRDLPYYSHHDAGSEVAGEHQEPSRMGWLVETGKPKELGMYEVPYKGPPIL
ncbi:hypothetical protein HU200_045118 [Digitaria exilis]|uniref:cysteine dioxygenase n=1 Tax=Digitaria exilis TaxID=1010633 RepID=A0A835EDC1_9POAL|nr:hypothetical protein HU200_045118 [Digitaria exilis]CAB3498745.1 unnamed protein product [Digitaria exilis]